MPAKTNEQDEKQQLIEFLAEFSDDPLGFVYAAFAWGEDELKGKDGPDKWQIELLEDIRDGIKTVDEVIREAIASGHGIGKSALVSWIILWAIATYEDTRGVVTANTDTQLKSKTWSELAKWYRLFIGKDLFTYTATALFSVDADHQKTWRIDAIPWSESNPEAFAGLHNEGKRILVIFDEASAISDKIWEVTEGALTDSNTQIIWCAFGNPTRNTGRFFDCFHKYRNRWHTKQIDSRTVRISNKKLIQEWVDDYGEDSDFVKVRVRGLFPSASVDQFISTALATAARDCVVVESQYSFAPAIIGVDPAWSGDDSFAIMLRQGLFSKKLAVYPKNDNDILMAGRIAKFQDDYSASAVFIDMGYGTGIYSAGVSMGRNNWQLVAFAEAATKEGFANKRAEMWSDAKDWLKEGGKLDDDQTLYNDLTAPESFINMRGKLQLESKQDMKKRGIPSPNLGDAFCLTFAFPVQVNTNTKYKKLRRAGKTRKAGGM